VARDARSSDVDVASRTLGRRRQPSFLRRLGTTAAARPDDLIRSELFGLERLEQHAESLAAAQPVTTSTGTCRHLARRLKDNGQVLFGAHRNIANAVREERAITPADEWLLDNFYVAQEQIRQVRRDLPPGFCRGLPKLAAGPHKGYPRVFGLAWALVAHTDSRLDRQTLVRFVGAYQRVQPLTIGELWAVPITLRIVLVENLRRAADQIARGRAASREADAVADDLLGVGSRVALAPEAALRRFDSTPLPRPFVVRLLQRLRDQDPQVTPALVWLDQRLALDSATTDDVVRAEHRRQGGMNVTVGNVITSMRLISALDWAEIFESLSLVDAELRAGSLFAEMDFPTRDRYRHAIEDLARGSRRTELDVARRAMAAAARPPEAPERIREPSFDRERDPGYYLIAHGRRAFEKAIQFHVPASDWLVRASTRAGIAGYVAAIAFVTLFILALPLLALSAFGVSGWPLVWLALLGLAPASDLAVAVVNRAITNDLNPKTLPALDLREGVPESLRTMVVVPTLLTTRAAIDEQIERLGVHHLASQDGDLRFALLSDWTDSTTQRAPGDDALLGAAADGIARLNRQYGPARGGVRFVLLHRRRLWNEGQGMWIGWERKRGKLHELNRWLRGATDTTFVPINGAPPVAPSGVRYVITLDADTRLKRGSAKRLVGKMAHSLNRPRLDPVSGRVVEGYGVMQPRVTPSLPTGRDGSLFQRVFTSPSGLDPYAFAVSDVYQDLFGEGSYTGKGIYDVDVFEAALDRRVPESTLLSHDLLEGIFARAGLVSDIEIVEEFPSRYDVAAARQHRWARGDWQLLPWIFGRGPRCAGDRHRRAIPLVGRWKMLDNLRRTVSAPAVFLALLAGWMLPPPAAAMWSGFVVATFALPPFIPPFAGLVPRLGVSQRRHWHTVSADLSLALLQVALLSTLIAHQAWLMADAIARTLLRLFLRHRRLLEWMTAAQSKASLRLTRRGIYRWMGGGVALAVGALVVVATRQPASWPTAAPFLILWMLSPLVARRASQPRGFAGALPISDADARALRLTARRTWRFFETFVTAGDHGLPPDNFQEDPAPVVAHRTSPTNIGLYLLSVIAARDFGWLGTIDAVERLEATLASMNSLERVHGHFYNWYDTQTLRPLEPRYVSSVDSGNLAGHLIALGSACREMKAQTTPAPEALRGIEDGLALTWDALGRTVNDRRTPALTRSHLERALGTLAGALASLHGRLSTAGLRTLLPHADAIADFAHVLSTERGDADGADVLSSATALRASIQSHLRESALPMASRLDTLMATARTMFDAMDFGFLFDHDRQLLSIGYRVSDGTLDPSCYDLLASESRLASFVAIAKGDVPTLHWFHLGRTVTAIHGGAALVSWSGSMFEYLMPDLVMRAPAGSLLDETNQIAVRRQVDFGAERGLPWGVSESAYNGRNHEFTYQYSSFGVPGLGLKRGLGGDAVVAPYATALAAMIAPDAAAHNFARLAHAGARGRYGWYEALDYTPARLPEGETRAVVRSYMAHHQGMTVVALADALHDGAMRSRFHADPIVQATELLLQERTPRDVEAGHPRREEARAAADVHELLPPTARRFLSPHQSIAHTQLLSNGRYSVMMTAAGSGYSRWGDLAVTRWREDPTCDGWGTYIFIRDVEKGVAWSAGYQPTGVEPDSYQATFLEDRVEIIRRDGSITSRLDVTVSPEDDAEARRLTISNGGRRAREIEVTSYAEIVLATAAADTAHPAFSNLFVQTEFVAEVGAVLATRRRRSPDDPPVWAAHLSVVDSDVGSSTQFETDRARFLGRGRDVRTARAVMDGQPLSNTAGAVLDPVFSLRRRFLLAPGATVHVTFWTLVASSRDEVLALVDQHHDAAAFDRASTLAWTQAQVQLFHLGIDLDEANLYQRLAGHLLYANPALRPSSEVLAGSEGGPEGLWAHGISGDLPILVCRIDDIADLQIVRQLLHAHEYWRLKQLPVDLVILNEHAVSYEQDLHAALEAAVRATPSRSASSVATRGAVFLLRGDTIPAETRRLLESVARAIVFGRRGSLFDQVRRLEESPPAVARAPHRSAANDAPAPVPPRTDLEFFNGLGGFANGGREYVTMLRNGQCTPAPWINVIANPSFGFQTSVEGGGYTWAINSQQHQLTPWCNDAVGDRPGEVLYVRDEEDGAVWTPTALPIREGALPYVVTHGQGFSRFEHVSHGISLTLLQYVAADDPIKISRLTITNQSDRSRRLSITAYVEWVLGASRIASAPYVATEIDPGTHAMLARNHWSSDFGPRVAFADLGGRQQAWTGDRKEFLGRNGTLVCPAALFGGPPLTNRVGGGLDPCGALQTVVALEPHDVEEVVFLLGETATSGEALSLVERYRAADLDAILRAVTGTWDEVLETVQVKTPDRAMDVLLNRWLLYQTLACRVWARAGFYQASGAYGFRDQLQDVLALCVSLPGITRAHLLRAAARQFVEGDVQHWWLPPSGQGVRTRISDDRIWLPYATAHYIAVTGDTGILDEALPFLAGPILTSGQSEAYFQPTTSPEHGTLFEHCARALDSSLPLGRHGLPLIGTGDWNDGLNRVGVGGQGESVWLGWFLHATLSAFAPLADRRGEDARGESWRHHTVALGQSLERDGWDGGWYRRAYFDDGTPLGGHASAECRIDSIAQSWAVLSGAADRSRAAMAMAEVDAQLVRDDEHLALIFTPPFDQGALDVGYIRGYPPGIRENGGQYTHAAVWSVIAWTLLGDGDKAARLFGALNPVNHARSADEVDTYKVEPYVMCADVYTEPAHVGRGGWTWYTGSAGWMYRAGLEWILGFRLRGTTLVIDPCVPTSWPRFDLAFRYRSARYAIAVLNPNGVSRGVSSVSVDGKAFPASGAGIPLSDDGAQHVVEVVLG
jgi:cyclic beta-1,2-glucan synthetase